MTEPPIDAPRDPLYKTEREIQKVWANVVVEARLGCSKAWFASVLSLNQKYFFFFCGLV